MNMIMILIGLLALTGARGVNVNGGNGTEKPQVTQGYYNPTGTWAKAKMNSRNIIDWRGKPQNYDHVEPGTYWIGMVQGQKTVFLKGGLGVNGNQPTQSIELYVPEHYTIE